jgi:2-dehydropantoate 2-reductase
MNMQQPKAYKIAAHGAEMPAIGLGTLDLGERCAEIVAGAIDAGYRHLDTETWIGPYQATPFAAVEEAAGLMTRAGLKVEALPDLRPAQWSKLIFNATVNAVAALTGLPHDPHFAAEDAPTDLGHLVHALIDEGKAIAAAAGVALHDDPWEMNVLATQRGSAHYPSMLEDVDSRRPTEVELINGALVRKAHELGVDAPLQTAVYRLVRAREASYS